MPRKWPDRIFFDVPNPEPGNALRMDLPRDDGGYVPFEFPCCVQQVSTESTMHSPSGPLTMMGTWSISLSAISEAVVAM